LITRDGVSPARITVSYNGVNVARFQGDRGRLRRELGIDASTRIVGTVCRLHRAKALDRLLAAFAAIHDAVAPARLIVVGDGPERAELERAAGRLGIASRVSWLGVRDDVAQIIRDFDVFAISSAWEGLPGTVFEAMAAGVPIVSTRVGGIGEVLRDGDNAVLVAAGSDGELAGGLVRVLTRPDVERDLASRAAEDVRDRFTFARAAAERVAWYRGLLTARAGLLLEAAPR
jgi:glycosyltransferase involved in cell wall biosynthesis